MARVVYVNGSYRRHGEAHVHVEDRGFQFADAVYEVIEVSSRQLVDATRHLDRLRRSLGELSICEPMSRPAMLHVIGEVVRRNRVTDGLVYMQVSRGATRRDFPYTDKALTPTFVCLARPVSPAIRKAKAQRGLRIVSLPDIRWGRCDIKTVMLLPAVLAKEQALAAGADEAWLVDTDGFVTEGASSNAWIVNADGQLQTRALSPALLAGVTRHTTLDVAAAIGLEVVLQPFTIADAYVSREAFATSASGAVMPIVELDGNAIGSGRPGPVAQALGKSFHKYAQHQDCP
ncbi:MAG: D-amino acid aminotransferase [Alphaproteobacteria bacterium BRH_c36]|nr:MAG: D-amino acid aminotransferase [Alphaproteobacteria bacterium BRH_c36]